MAHLCVPQNQALGVSRGFAPDIQVCGTHGREDLVNAAITLNAEEEDATLRFCTLILNDPDICQMVYHHPYAYTMLSVGTPVLSDSDFWYLAFHYPCTYATLRVGTPIFSDTDICYLASHYTCACITLQVRTPVLRGRDTHYLAHHYSHTCTALRVGTFAICK